MSKNEYFFTGFGAFFPFGMSSFVSVCYNFSRFDSYQSVISQTAGIGLTAVGSIRLCLQRIDLHQTCWSCSTCIALEIGTTKKKETRQTNWFMESREGD